MPSLLTGYQQKGEAAPEEEVNKPGVEVDKKQDKKKKPKQSVSKAAPSHHFVYV
jgi:hypothetical protein|tara:strand:+ start:423 stop:584 length:162 start_codon:yes stop_codon:yes gene_type:complete